MPEVGMLDLTDRTLHLPGDVHLYTKCGVRMDHCQVGPLSVLRARSCQFCTDCYMLMPF